MRKPIHILTTLALVAIFLWGIIPSVSNIPLGNSDGKCKTDKTEWLSTTVRNTSVSTVDFFTQPIPINDYPIQSLYVEPILQRMENQTTTQLKAFATDFIPESTQLVLVKQLQARDTIDSLHS